MRASDTRHIWTPSRRRNFTSACFALELTSPLWLQQAPRHRGQRAWFDSQRLMHSPWNTCLHRSTETWQVVSKSRRHIAHCGAPATGDHCTVGGSTTRCGSRGASTALCWLQSVQVLATSGQAWYICGDGKPRKFRRGTCVGARSSTPVLPITLPFPELLKSPSDSAVETETETAAETSALSLCNVDGSSSRLAAGSRIA
mmetsp:Transcript_6460/g.16072  ORF Transcript_6460/g.16072 Transcript_6460/m.16072 type:complete len:200 (+) Transcript_6460:179-778(+)